MKWNSPRSFNGIVIDGGTAKLPILQFFFFCPQSVGSDYIARSSGTIARVFILLTSPSRPRLRLLHRRRHDASVSLQCGGKELLYILSSQISEEIKLQTLELGRFMPGDIRWTW